VLDPVPESVWEKFLTDSEEAILRSAPREPSAGERAAPRGNGRGTRSGDAVGELWRLDDRPGPAWRHLGTRDRLRRAGRVLGAAAILGLLLGLFSCLPAGSPRPLEEPQEAGPRQSRSAAADPSAAMEPHSLQAGRK
jgi:hypothetical protein